ncbi:MAG: hypothetical protein LBS89_00390 [Zoogloeaceae bacterium]|jgi:hypothetical protein|nr:hypothetical protein [Zoogloeaceae bacterium]
MTQFIGSVNSLADLQTFILTTLSTNGWTVSGATAARDDIAVALDVADIGRVYFPQVALRLKINDAPGAVGVGALNATPTVPYIAMTFPATCWIFIHTDPVEVYVFVNYDVDYYQWLAFGQSPAAGAGSGVWAGATIGVPLVANGGTSRAGPVGITATTGGGGNSDITPAALLWSTLSSVAGTLSRNSYWNSGAWVLLTQAIQAAAPHVARSPSAWNNEAILIPLRPAIAAAESRVQIVGQIAHARYIRVDHYAPGEIITLGSEQWRVFPWYCKNTAARDGGSAVAHTGTFGVALKL